MTEDDDLAFTLAFSGCGAVLFLLLIAFGLLKTAQRFGKEGATPVLAFRIPLLLREVAGRLSEVSAELPELPEDSRALTGFRTEEDLALLYHPSVMEAHGFGWHSQTASFDGAAFLWEENPAETTVLFLAEPITGLSLARSLRLAARRGTARRLMEELRRMTGISFRELPVEDAERLRARLQGEWPWLGRRALAVEQALVLSAFPFTPLSALQTILAGALSSFSALLVAALLAEPLRQGDNTGFFIPLIGLLGSVFGAAWFLHLSAADLSRRCVRSFHLPDPEALRSSLRLPWRVVPLLAAAGPLAVWLAALGQDGALWGSLLDGLAPATLEMVFLLLWRMRPWVDGSQWE